MNQPMPVTAGSEFKDRRNGLIGFGILLIILGCICALFVPLMLMALVLTSGTAGIETDYRTFAPAAVTYFLLAVIFIILGIGSIKARRWARALTLTLAWGWLLTGIFSVVLMIFLMPKISAEMQALNPGMPDSLNTVIAIVPFGTVSILFILLPGLLVLFYGSRHVRATCEARNAVPCWTDACPMSVLALSLFCGLGAGSMLLILLIYNSIMPFFGCLATGLPGAAMLLGMTALWGYCTWAIYRLKPAGWWILLISMVALGISSAITFTQVDLMEAYRLMGYPEQQIAQFQKYNFFNRNFLVLSMSVSLAFMVGYLLYVKKYFRRPA
jgi:hypothetical protein